MLGNLFRCWKRRRSGERRLGVDRVSERTPRTPHRAYERKPSGRADLTLNRQAVVATNVNLRFHVDGEREG